MGSSPTSTRSIESFGTSAVEATRTLANARRQLLLDQVPNVLHRHPVQDLLEEALHQHALRHRARNAPAGQIEEVLRVNGADGGPVAAAEDVVVQDLEDWLGCGSCLLRQEKVPVGLIGRGPAGILLHAHGADIHAAGRVTQGSLEEQVRLGVGGDVILQGPKVKGLLAGPEKQPFELRLAASAIQDDLNAEHDDTYAQRQDD